MKKSVFVCALAVVALVATSCASSPKAAAPAAAPAAEAVDQYPDLPPVKVVSDFEGEETLNVYNGPSSKVAVDFSTEQAKSGTRSAKVMNETKDWGGAILELTEAQADWTGYNFFRMWVYGSNSGNTFFTDIEELESGELFRATFKDDFEGWKQLEIDLRTLKSRSDYQNPGAKADKVFQSPIKTVQFCCTTAGTFNLYFDDFTVEK